MSRHFSGLDNKPESRLSEKTIWMLQQIRRYLVIVIDQYNALKTYLAFDNGALAEAPQSLAANVSHQKHCEI